MGGHCACCHDPAMSVKEGLPYPRGATWGRRLAARLRHQHGGAADGERFDFGRVYEVTARSLLLLELTG